MFSVKIAGINMRVQAADSEFFARRLSGYAAADGPPDMVLRSFADEELCLPDGEICGASGSTVRLRLADGRLCHAVKSAKTGKWLTVQIYTPDYADVEIHMLASRRHQVFSLTDFEYMYTGAMFSNRLTKLGGTVLHSSSLSYRGEGIAFSANCGTGKSTHTGLWKQYFGDDVIIVNDDKPAITFPAEGPPMLHGTPWSGKTDINSDVHVPLRAIVFLEQAPDNSIRTLSTGDAIFQMTSQIARPYYDADIGVMTLDAIERLLLSVPVYMLSCNISEEAVMTVYRTVFK